MVEQIIEDSASPENDQTVTTKKRINGKWVTTVKKKK